MENIDAIMNAYEMRGRFGTVVMAQRPEPKH